MGWAMDRWRSALAAVTLGATFLSTGCGGGGGGANSGDAAVTVTAQPTSIHVDLVEGQTASSASGTFLLTLKSAPGTVYPRMRLTGEVNAVAALTLSIINDRDARATITAGSGATVGTFSGSAVLDVCGDRFCSYLLNQYTYPVTVNIRRGFNLVPSVAVGVAEGETGLTDLALTLPDTPGTLSVDPLPEFVTVDTSVAGRLRLNYSAGTLPPSDYFGLVRLRYLTSSGVPLIRELQVSMSVGPGLIAPAPVTLNWQIDTTAAGLRGVMDVTSARVGPVNWTASSSVDWLVLDQASGSTPGGQIAFHVDPVRAAALENRSSHVATVTIGSSGLRSVTQQITLDKSLASAHVALPLVIAPGQPAQVQIAGRGFSSLAAPVQQIRITGPSGTVAPTQVAVLGDETLSIGLPALAAGSYRVSVPNRVGPTTNEATLTVRTPAAFPPGFLPHAGVKNLVLHDPVRDQIYAVNRSGIETWRYRHDGTAWQIDVGGFGQLLNLGLAPDGHLYGSSVGSQLIEIDPVAWQVLGRVDNVLAEQQRIGGLPTTADGRLWVPNMGYWDLVSRRYVFGASTQLAGSADGLTMYAFPIPPLRYSLGGTFTASLLLGGALEGEISDDGQRLFVNSQTMYDATLNVLGQLNPVGAGEFLARSRLSPDGTRIYALVIDLHTSNDDALRLDVFDTTQLEPGTFSLRRLRSIALPVAAVSSCNSGPRPNGCQFLGTTAVTADGSRFLWAGNLGLAVIDVTEAPGPLLQPARALGVRAPTQQSIQPAWGR